MCDSEAEAPPRPLDDGAPAITDAPMAEHLQAVRSHHRFAGVARCGVPWDLSHLEPFAFRVDPGLGFEVTVVVLFSCHCFTRSLARDGRARSAIPSGELFDNGRETRVLCEERYELSRRHLPDDQGPAQALHPDRARSSAELRHVRPRRCPCVVTSTLCGLLRSHTRQPAQGAVDPAGAVRLCHRGHATRAFPGTAKNLVPQPAEGHGAAPSHLRLTNWATKTDGHQRWPSHAGFSIALTASSQSSWDPIARVALPVPLRLGRS